MNLASVDLNLLVAFDAMMMERSVTRAGARVGRTQPAMSNALKRLRDLTGDELFIRSAEGLQPTRHAVDLHEEVGRALAGIDAALSLSHRFEPERADMAFTIAMSDHPTFVLLPRLCERLAAAAPGIRLHVRGFVDRDEGIRLLDDGRADLAIGVPPTRKAGRILSRPLFEDSFVCLLRKGHPATQQPLTLERYLALSHILVSPEDERFGIVDEALAKLGRTRRLALTLPNMYAAPRIVARSDHIATLLAGVAASMPEELVEMRPVPLALPRIAFTINWHRRNDAHPAQRWVRGLIGEVALDVVGVASKRPAGDAAKVV